MTDRDAFLAAIRSATADDLPRLVFADWLDDHGDPAWAELIRVQVELEPIHEELDNPRRRELADCETELLALHADRWLGPVHDLAAEYPAYGPVFRRGLPESVSLSLDTFLARGGELFAACPTVREVCVYGVAGRGADLAACPHLAHVETLEIADWLTYEDAEHLLSVNPPRGHPHMLRWFGGSVVAAARFLAALGVAPHRTVEFVQLLDPRELDWYEADDERYRFWDVGDHAATINTTAGREVVRVVRPFDRLYPLVPDLGYGLVAGRLGHGTAALAGVNPDGYTVTTFDDDGRMLTQMGGGPVRGFRTATGDIDALVCVWNYYGFEPEELRVWEFNRGRYYGLSLGLWPRDHVRDYLTNPFDRPPGVTDRWWNHRGGVLKRWLHEGRFVIQWDGREFVLDATGTVISS